jgi:hypothetical protein
MTMPSVDPMGGWPGKLLSGLIGQQANLPNIAGAVQQPKQPKGQDDSDKPGQDPGNGGQQTGPSGSKDDPMHVNVTNAPPAAPQGQAHSAANLNASMATGIGATA